MYDCPECGTELHLPKPNMWYYVNTKFKCENCNTLLTMYTDCSYDPESGEEYLWFEVDRAFIGFDEPPYAEM